MRAGRSPAITIEKLRLADDAEADRRFWARMTPAERLVETWRLSLELWRFKGWDPGEPGLRGPVTRAPLR